MTSRRHFLRTGLASAAALTLAGCAEGDEPASLGGILPISYGDARSQVVELLLPDTFGPYPVVVLIHGGWWRADGFDRRAGRELAADLVEHGYATWNLEYRLTGEPGGGWPGTFEDVARGIDALADEALDFNLDLDHVVVVGHSAGGHLALWAGARDGLWSGAVGSEPRVTPRAVVAQAPITDLVRAADEGLGDGAVVELMGATPTEAPLVYLATSPAEMVPMEIPQLLLHGTEDDRVPVDQSRTYVELARAAGDPVDYIEIEGGDHFVVIDTTSDAWAAVRDRMDALLDGRLS